MKPSLRPARNHFASGPCSKRPGWDISLLGDALVGRSHRSTQGRALLRDVIERTKALLGVPEDYVVGIVPGSDTGAFEMAMWSLLGARGVDVFAWESFGKGWATDITKQLRLVDVRVFEAGYGLLPDLALADFTRDVVFAWNGTTSGVCVPNGDWIPAAPDRPADAGLVLCDATSAVYALDVPLEKLDVVTYSWQKVLGGEAAHGMLMLSPRAVKRLESYAPSWPLPKIFRLTKGGRLIDGIFVGDTINTPSMLCVEDALDGLRWAEEIGGLEALKERSRANLEAVEAWVERTDWVDFLATTAAIRSRTSICLRIVDPWFVQKSPDEQSKAAKQIVALLDEEGVAYDVGAYRDAPPGLRLWGGATVEREDLEALFPWLDWAWLQVKSAG